MKKEWILSEEARTQKRLKIEANRARKVLKCQQRSQSPSTALSDKPQAMVAPSKRNQAGFPIKIQRCTLLDLQTPG